MVKFGELHKKGVRHCRFALLFIPPSGNLATLYRCSEKVKDKGKPLSVSYS